jgi:arylsulfatase A-like enzyme
VRRYPAAVARSALAAAVLFLGIQAPLQASSGGPPPGWQPPHQFSSLATRPQYVFLLILDGALPSYFTLGRFPHIAALIRRGVTYSRAWDGMLESETPTGHASLGTGSLPRRHGVISFSWVTDKDVSEQPTNPIPIRQGQLELMLHRSGVPSLASLLKQHDPGARVVVTSGHKDYAVDSVGGWAADYMMFYGEQGQTWAPIAIPRHVPPRTVMQAPGLTAYAPHLAPGDQDSLAVRLALSAFHQLRQRLTIINLPEFDWPLGHLQGGAADRAHAWQLMNRLDGDIGTIENQLRSLRLLSKTLFVLTADHGMVTLNHQVPHEIIQSAVAAAGTSLSDYDFHTAGYLWLRDRARAGQVASKVIALHNPSIRAVYYREPGTYSYLLAPGTQVLPALDRAYQFLLSTLAGPNAPQVAIFLHEDASIHGREQIGWRGDHGGPSWYAQRIPLVFAGPGVRHSVSSTFPATIYDIAPTVLSLLGVPPTGMDGIVLNDALANPDDRSGTVQSQQAAKLTPIVQALIDQTRRDGP